MQNAENITKFTPSFFLISTICKHLNRAELYPFFFDLSGFCHSGQSTKAMRKYDRYYQTPHK